MVPATIASLPNGFPKPKASQIKTVFSLEFPDEASFGPAGRPPPDRFQARFKARFKAKPRQGAIGEILVVKSLSQLGCRR